MSSLPEPWLSPEEYLALERAAETKSEYYDGQMFAMSGASEPHNVITVNLSREISTQLRGRPCRTYSNDMRVRVSETGLYTYPDVVVVCGERRFDDAQRDTLLNPTLLIEVLSPSTELYDRVKKFAQYRQLESLTDYLLVAQDRPAVDHYTKQGDQDWLLRAVEGLEGRIDLPSVGCSFLLSDIYENVDFPAEEGRA